MAMITATLSIIRPIVLNFFTSRSLTKTLQLNNLKLSVAESVVVGVLANDVDVHIHDLRTSGLIFHNLTTETTYQAGFNRISNLMSCSHPGPAVGNGMSGFFK